MKKLFFIGLLISSNFVLHCNRRPDDTTIELLKDMFDILNKTKEKLGVQPPQITLILKEATKLEDFQEFKNILY